MLKNIQKGFTLIELMIVIAIIRSEERRVGKECVP